MTLDKRKDFYIYIINFLKQNGPSLSPMPAHLLLPWPAFGPPPGCRRGGPPVLAAAVCAKHWSSSSPTQSLPDLRTPVLAMPKESACCVSVCSAARWIKLIKQKSSMANSSQALQLSKWDGHKQIRQISCDILPRQKHPNPGSYQSASLTRCSYGCFCQLWTVQAIAFKVQRCAVFSPSIWQLLWRVQLACC